MTWSMTKISTRKKKTSPAPKTNYKHPNAASGNGITLPSDGASAQQLLRVLTEVKNGNFKVRMPINAVGLDGKVYDTLNEIIALNEKMMLEFTRAGNTIGKQGKLTQRITIPSAQGSWSDGVNSLNVLISDLVHPTIEIANVISSVAKGNLSQEMPEEIGDHKLEGEFLRIAKEVNYMVKQLNLFSMEVTRVAREVGSEGKLGGQAKVKGVGGVWKDLTDSVNHMAGNLTGQVRNIAGVTTAVANGDLSKKITVDVRGEMLELKNTINTMVDQLNSFASEVTRVALEVGTEGKLGGQATVKGVGGTWKDLTDSVNQMASNLTGQVRGIAKVVTSVAKGNLKQKLSINALGELAQLTDTINEMIDTLAVFADQVTTVAREVGVEGRLGGQASVPGASGTWKGLTENVNQLAANLTTQVRSISEVATAVTKGDLTRTIRVDAKGELEALKDNINEMIRNLKETTQKNAEQDWLKTNLARFTRLLQGQRDLQAVTRLILSELVPVVSAQQAVVYTLDNSREEP